jgi:glycosyltransferase involved in cell wall biosynthesis
VVIAVCIITYRRPKGLRAALDALAAQVFDRGIPELRIVVVDNDETGSARATCDAARPTIPWPLEYAIEPRRGIPFARNRCIEVARPGVDWIGFIDDDEEPEASWLAELLRIQAQFQADVVTGPVLPRFDGAVPRWAEKGRFFHRQRFASGTRRDRAFTNNVLFRAEIFDSVHPHFDERMVMTGGSDTHFSRRVSAAGFSIVWADEAQVRETFPTSRMTARWVYQRAYRIGTTTAFIARDLESLPVASAKMLSKALFQLVSGTLLAATGWIVGRHHAIRGVRHVCNGAGLVVGLMGGRYDEYRQTHGG